MNWEAVVSGSSLAMDAFAVSVCMGACIRAGVGRTALSMGFSCGTFQFLMPLLGWVMGDWASGWIEALDHWLAFFLLFFVGGNMLREGRNSSGEDSFSALPPGLKVLLSLSLATSIDAFVVGAGFALIHLPVAPLALTAGTVTALACIAGVSLGRIVGCHFGKRVELLGGILLIIMGSFILVSHLWDHGGLKEFSRLITSQFGK